MTVYIADIPEYERAFTRLVEEDVDHDYEDQLEEYESHFYPLTAAELIEASIEDLAPEVVGFFQTVFWGWMENGRKVYASQLDPEVAELNSALPPPEVAELWRSIQPFAPSDVAQLVFAKSEVFEDVGELTAYFAAWWALMERAHREQKGVLILAE